MNEFNIIGKVLGSLDIKQSENGYNYAQMLLSVKRPYKNKDGNYDTDVIQFTLFNNLVEEAKTIINDGMPVVVKGHINANNYSKDGKVIYSTSVIADRISVVDQLY